ncbi:MAG TPA: flippase activity-associated protein Agl23 [Planctomycetota bacterium]|nr:flippase activity-associated protein Agl23 [Planctomycetota bacterium]
MTRRLLPLALLLAVAAGALAIRLPRLDLRPLHGDEAVEAFKTGLLYDNGFYRYDPHEYHGPTLHYATLPFLWLSGARSFADSSEVTFRLVDVAFGVGLILLLPLLADGLGWPATLVAAALTAISPAMVFYSRYYVHESLLVFFTLAAIATAWRYARCGKLAWAILAAASLALMHATKETCALAFIAMALALAAKLGWRKIWGETIRVRGLIRPRHVAIAIAAGLAISATFFTSFFTNWRGPLDSILAFGNYLQRSGGAGLHDHPWHYYLGILAYARYGPGIWWSECLILALAAIGLVAALWPSGHDRPKPPLLRFLAFYTLILTSLYAAVPYKTPWCMLSFLHGMILLAGVGTVALIRLVPTHLLKAVATLLLALGGWQLAGQAWRASLDRRWVADRRNPYVYAHTAFDLLEIPRRAEQIAALHPQGHQMVIKIICPDRDYWPLPFYLRRFPHIGYWDAPPPDPDAPLIIGSTQFAEELEKKLGGRYFVETRGLRPTIRLNVFIRKDLWDAFLARQAHAAPQP